MQHDEESQTMPLLLAPDNLLRPDDDYHEWMYDGENGVDQLRDEIVHDLRNYALPFIDRFANLEMVLNVLEGEGIRGPFTLDQSDLVAIIGAIHYVEGRRAKAVQIVDDALVALEGKPHKFRYPLKAVRKRMDELAKEIEL
ncbi:MAG: hypothetical protein H7X80_06205 [bacterium]|nr:hypothetical protein [Candidatus Kapabacteria bacterium]